MNCCETLNPNLELTHKQGKDATIACFHSDVLSVTTGRRFSNLKSDLWKEENNYQELIIQYSNRCVTFEDDRLNVFTGIIRHFERKTSVRQLWGVPYYLYDNSYQRFVRNLFWAHKSRCGDDVTLNRPGGTIIPSWSRVG